LTTGVPVAQASALVGNSGREFRQYSGRERWGINFAGLGMSLIGLLVTLYGVFAKTVIPWSDWKLSLTVGELGGPTYAGPVGG